MSQNAIAFSFHSENPYQLSSSPHSHIHLAFHLETVKDVPGQRRLPLNLSLVMDRSGSMEGDKLNFVKKALAFVIEQLRAEDQLSIVTYDDVVQVLFPQQAVRDKAALLRQVAGIASGNTTNLSGGMLEGFAQVRGTKSANCVNRVLLLSDGLANEGVTEPDKLQQIARTKFMEDGIGLSSFGVGADYNEDLMTALAEHGGGNYFFIDTADKIPGYFAKELQGLLAVVAQRTRVRIHYPAAQVRPVQVLGYVHAASPGLITVEMNDLFAGEERALVLDFEPLPSMAGPVVFAVELEYEDVALRLGSVRERQELTVTPITDAALYRASVRHDTLDLVAQYIANQLLEQAILAVDRRDKAAATNWIGQARLYLDTVFQLVQPSDNLRLLLQRLEAYEQRLNGLDRESREEFSMAQKQSKAASINYSKRRT
jgi:Ca-activated chloride channel homolog